MIHKLYVNIAGWSKLDIDHNKKIIIDTMIYDNKIAKHTWYKIVSEDDQVPPKMPTESITLRNQEEIDEYIKSYNQEMLSNMSCVELKREIVENQSIKTLKK